MTNLDLFREGDIEDIALTLAKEQIKREKEMLDSLIAVYQLNWIEWLTKSNKKFPQEELAERLRNFRKGKE